VREQVRTYPGSWQCSPVASIDGIKVGRFGKVAFCATLGCPEGETGVLAGRQGGSLPTFEDIKLGGRLRGLDAAGVAEVSRVARFGADALSLVFRVNGRVGERLRCTCAASRGT